MNPRADHIKQALTACRTPGDIHRVSDQYRAEVQRMHRDPVTRVYAIHVANLKAYLLADMRERDR